MNINFMEPPGEELRVTFSPLMKFQFLGAIPTFPLVSVDSPRNYFCTLLRMCTNRNPQEYKLLKNDAVAWNHLPKSRSQKFCVKEVRSSRMTWQQVWEQDLFSLVERRLWSNLLATFQRVQEVTTETGTILPLKHSTSRRRRLSMETRKAKPTLFSP